MIKHLSEREREVAVLVANGKKDEEIARLLFISRRRVGEIIAIIKEKWRVRSRVEIGIGAYHYGWLHSGGPELEEVLPFPFYLAEKRSPYMEDSL